MDMRFLGRLRSGSNAVFLAEDSSDHSRWIVKPVRGEAPLRDFPAGILPPAAAQPESSLYATIQGTLAAREVAFYRVAHTVGWDVVPDTCAVHTIAGPAMAQRWLDTDTDTETPTPAPRAPTPLVVAVDPAEVPVGMVPVLNVEDDRGRPLVVAHADSPRLRRIAVLDAVCNNTDRKAGHLLRDHSGTEWAIDHGLSFHSVPKVRSVLWGFWGQPLGDAMLTDLTTLRAAATAGPLAEDLAELLFAPEVAAFCSRMDEILATGTFPGPTVDFPLPWPLF